MTSCATLVGSSHDLPVDEHVVGLGVIVLPHVEIERVQTCSQTIELDAVASPSTAANHPRPRGVGRRYQFDGLVLESLVMANIAGHSAPCHGFPSMTTAGPLRLIPRTNWASSLAASALALAFAKNAQPTSSQTENGVSLNTASSDEEQIDLAHHTPLKNRSVKFS